MADGAIGLTKLLLPYQKKISTWSNLTVYIMDVRVPFRGTCGSLGMLSFCVLLALSPDAVAQSGRVTGQVTDEKTNEPLIGAHVLIKGTAIGAATNVDGIFLLPSVQAGDYELSISYLGYRGKLIPIRVNADSTLRVNAGLEFDVVQLGEVVVTAQLEGQAEAINKQLTSNTIVNVVSKDRIQELPDQNAAESVARLPGISIQRDAGEGQKVVVRGLAPRFSAITVNGERIPSTDAQDRSVDLSMISSDILSGIEVFKALTPDKDGDAVGGTVNLVLKHAPPGLRGELRAQEGYNRLRRDVGQPRGSFSLSNRFLDDALGILVTGTAQRANRSSDLLTANYVLKSAASGPGQTSVIGIEDLNLAYASELRDRFGGGITADYDLGDGGDLFFSGFASQTERSRTRMRKRYRVGAFRTEYDMLHEKQKTGLVSVSLNGEHKLSDFAVDWRVGYSRSKQEVPYSLYSRFQEVGAFNNGLIDDQGPELIPMFAKNDLAATWFQYASFDPTRVSDRDRSAQANVKLPFRFGDDIAGTIKMGGKYRTKDRNRDVTEFLTPFAEIDRIGQADTAKFTLYRGQNILIENFLDPSFQAKNFLDGRYDLPVGLSSDQLDEFHSTYQSHYMLNRFFELQDYSAGENISAGYLMAEVNIGTGLTIIPGFRYEKTKTSYHGKYGFLQGNLGEVGTIKDTTGGQDYDEILPMIHVRYRFTPWFDVRVAYTKSLARPNYFNLVPYEEINFAEQTYVRGNAGLKHTRSTNYDLYISLYSNDLGLLTLGGYYKSLKDIDYIKTTRIIGGTFNAFQLTEPVNGDKSDVWGIEIDVQTNLRNLPAPFDGIVINANYSTIRSKTFFPFFAIGPRSPLPPFTPTIIDTVREGTLPGQSNYIGNFSVGYEKGGFSGRVSVTIQGKSLQTVGVRSELDGYANSFVRWDASANYRFSPLLSIFADLNNFTNQPDQAYLGEVSFPTNEQYFGWTADIGVRLSF